MSFKLSRIAEAAAPTVNLDPNKIEFGRIFTPTWLACAYKNGAWETPHIDRIDDVPMHPAAIVFHYGQAIFEGMKAYKWADGSVNLFRPIENARRFNRSASRMAMPELNETTFVEGIRTLVDQHRAWVPPNPGSLYIRPTMIATEPCIGVRTANEFLFFTITMPSGSYFPQTSNQSDAGMISVFITTKVGRAARGGTGNVKAAANYAVTLQIIAEGKAQGCSQVLFLDAAGKGQIEEMGGMNIFFIEGKKLITPSLNDTILAGITRDSIVKLAPTLGYKVEERIITLDELTDKIKKGSITEAFACGTAAVICGIKNFKLDNGEEIKVGSGASGPITNHLYDQLTGIQYGKYPDPFNWIVKV